MTSIPNDSASSTPVSTTEHDYVIVGGGSAGCVLANRLSADPTVSVLLLEAGPDAEPFWVRTPAGVGSVYFDERINWKFSTEPEPGLEGRTLYWPRGKLIGGSSAINGMVYIRGFAADYDHWGALGNAGWNWEEAVRYFKRAESNDMGAGDYHGAEGPLRVSRPGRQHPATDAFIASGVRAGLQRNEDMAGATQEGIGYLQHTIGDGLRSSTGRAYLRPVRNRSNLEVVGRAHAQCVTLKDGRATGVQYLRGGASHLARARREVILCAGAVGSPQLLMLSGIGPADHLRELGIEVLHDHPGVGENLQDHLAINAGFEVRPGMSLNSTLSGWKKFLRGAGYLLTKSGPLAVGASHAVAFVRSRPELQTPDIQLSFRPLSFAFNADNQLRMHGFPGIQFASAMLRPESRGRIRLHSARVQDAPAIVANYLATPGDEKVMVATLKWIRRIAASAPLRDIVVREDVPGPDVRTDEDMLSYVRRFSQTLYHPVGTCSMGQGPEAVVDARLRVHRVADLRVVDASVMPTIVSGNTNAPTIMIAEKAADMIAEDARER